MSRAEDFSDNLLFKREPFDEGYNRIIVRGEKGMKHLEFGMLHLSSSERWSGNTAGCEVVLDIHQGIISVETQEITWKRLGGRKSVFDGLPTALYLPPQTEYIVKVAEGPVEIAVSGAPSSSRTSRAAVVQPEDITWGPLGQDNWQRNVIPVIADNVDAAKLILIETVTPPGNWSSAPPHKHDAFIPPREAPLEEIYYFRVHPEQGFGVIRIYTGPNDPGPMDEVYVIEDGDAVVIPRGYHIIGAAPGYSLHSTCVLAGDVRKPGTVTYDPRHSWIENA